MPRSSAEERILVKLETAAGDGGGGTAIQLPLDRLTLQPVEPKAQHRSAGCEVPSGESQARTHCTWDGEGALDANVLPYILGMLFGAETSSPFEYAPDPYASDPIQTLAIQTGSDTHAEEAPYGVCESLRIRLTKTDPSITCSGFAQTANLDATLWTTPTILPKAPADGALWYVQVGATIGGLATIPSEECEFNLGPRWGPHFQNDEGADTFTEHVKLASTPTVNLDLQALDDADDLWEASRLKEGRFLRATIPSNVEFSAGNTYEILITIYGTITAPKRQDKDNIFDAQFVFHPEPHTDLGGSWINIKVTNGRTL